MILPMGKRGEWLDVELLPGNPRVCEVAYEQWEFLQERPYPAGMSWECKRCGDCCRWNFMVLRPMELGAVRKMVAELRSRAEYPHGSWDLTEDDELRMKMPGASFTGMRQPEQAEFLRLTGRAWGYWVLKGGQVVLYNPTSCIHLSEDNLCEIYDDRPETCQAYSCRRFPSARKGL